jgi:transglutaminase-like putative cysteine protease
VRLEIRYRTTYEYNPPVRDGITALRLRPAPRPGLTVHGASLRSEPGVSAVSYIDGWGTRVDLVEYPGAHASVAFDMRAQVETHPGEIPAGLTAAEPLLYLADSEKVRRDAVAPLGWAMVDASWTAVESVLAWIPQRFLYQVGATDADTPIEEVISQGAGVCQDFAHIFLALLRSWGMPARYVSGYFFSAPAEAQRIEAEAMHAWVEVWRTGMGWVGLDATAGAYTDDRYVPVGYGRDYDDVRPIRGVIRGRTAQSQSARLEMQQLQQQ